MRTTERPSFALQILRAAILFVIWWLLAGAAPAFAEITFVVFHPAEGANGEPVEISLFVVSPTEVLSVVATAGGRSVPLSYNSVGNEWRGSLSLDGLARGPYTMVIEASNAGGETAQVSRGFIYDKLPIIKIVQPVNGTIGQPDFPIKAECIDDGPTCELMVWTPFFTTKATNTPIDTVVRTRDGTHTLEFTATDSTGRFSLATRQVFVSSRGGLSVADTFQGTILRIDADRALTFDNTVIPHVVRLYDRAADTSQIIWTAASADETVRQGHLTPGDGALFVVSAPATFPDRLLEWRGGALTQVASVSSGLLVKGAWAVFEGVAQPCCPAFGLILRDLTTGTNMHVAAYPAGNADVAPDGRVVFSAPQQVPHEILEFNPNPPPGTTTALTASAPRTNQYPRTDGINVVFTRTMEDATRSIVLRTQAGVEEVLASGFSYDPLPSNGFYRVVGGRTAFVRPESGLWIREPNGTVRPVWPRGFVEALDASGDMVFATNVTVNGVSSSTRYLAKADGTVRELGVAIGGVGFIGGTPVVVAGDRLMEIPTPPSRSILAEGATGTFFSTDVAILNAAATPVPVTIRYFREGQPELSEPRTLPARSRTTIHLDDVPGLEGTSVSTQIDGPPGAPVVVERLMSWDATGYGGHLGNAVDAPRKRWYFAEGAQGFFSTFFLIANSGPDEAAVTFRFLVEQGQPVTHTMKVPPAARRTFYAGDLAGLVNRSFATQIESDVPVVAERAMYFGDSPFWLGGHGSAGVGEPAYDWFHAEGATGSLFDTYILLANPHYFDASVTLTFTTDSGITVTRNKTVPADGRLTINIEDESPDLASVNVSTRVRSSNYPIVSERAMYWGTTGSGWREAHNSFGFTAPRVKWGLAEGRAGGNRGYQTYVLVSNATESAADLRVTFIREDGMAFEKSYSAQPGTRLNIPASSLPELANSNFATIVESLDLVPINVESAIYWNAGGVVWESGGNTVATPIS
jgi:hypothetical protein